MSSSDDNELTVVFGVLFLVGVPFALTLIFLVIDDLLKVKDIKSICVLIANNYWLSFDQIKAKLNVEDISDHDFFIWAAQEGYQFKDKDYKPRTKSFMCRRCQCAAEHPQVERITPLGQIDWGVEDDVPFTIQDFSYNVYDQ